MIIFWLSQDSNVTPPVCLATIAAASVAGTNFWQTGWAGVRIGFVAYIVPFLVVYYPELIFQGAATDIVAVILKSFAGVIVLCFSVSGFLYDNLGPVERTLTGAAGVVLLVAPYETLAGLAAIAASFAVVAVLVVRGRTRIRTASG